MTTGNVDYSDVPGMNINTQSFVGLIGYKSWNGGDRAPRERVPKAPPYTIYRDGKWFTFRQRFRDSPPPYRQSLDNHDYFKTEKRSTSEAVSVTFGWNAQNVAGNTAASQQGTGFNGGAITQTLMDSNDDIKVVNKLREKLRGSDFDASVFLGEGKQTLAMLANSAIRIRKSMIHLRRGDLAGSARSLLEGTTRNPLRPYSTMKQFNGSNAQTVANNWIELQYGWLPLLSDSYALGESLAHRFSVPLEMKVSASLRKSRANNVGTYVGWYPQYPGDPFGKYLGTVAGYHQDETLKVTCYIKERPSYIAELGLTQPENVLWELTPWSFVADWFIPIGNYLQARGLSSIYPGTYCTSRKVKGKNHPVKGVSSTNGAGDVKNWGADGFYPTTRGHAENFSYTRTYSSAPTVPLPSFKPLAKAASWQHCANAVALLVQQFAGRGGPAPEAKFVNLVKARTGWRQGG